MPIPPPGRDGAMVCAGAAAAEGSRLSRLDLPRPVVAVGVLGGHLDLNVPLLLVAFAMRGFQQQWNVEIEMPREDADGYGGPGQIQPA